MLKGDLKADASVGTETKITRQWKLNQEEERKNKGKEETISHLSKKILPIKMSLQPQMPKLMKKSSAKKITNIVINQRVNLWSFYRKFILYINLTKNLKYIC